MAKKTANNFAQLEGFMEEMFGGDTASELLASAQKDVFNGAGRVISDIKSDHPWKDHTGKLTRGHRKKRVGKLNVKIYNKVKYAFWLYEGTVKHFIKPSAGKTLTWAENRFYSNGHWVSGVWGAGGSVARDTPTNAPQKYWIAKGWDKQRDKTIKKVGRNLIKLVGL